MGYKLPHARRPRGGLLLDCEVLEAGLVKSLQNEFPLSVGPCSTTVHWVWSFQQRGCHQQKAVERKRVDILVGLAEHWLHPPRGLLVLNYGLSSKSESKEVPRLVGWALRRKVVEGAVRRSYHEHQGQIPLGQGKILLQVHRRIVRLQQFRRPESTSAAKMPIPGATMIETKSAYINYHVTSNVLRWASAPWWAATDVCPDGTEPGISGRCAGTVRRLVDSENNQVIA